ncbi:Cof-type HAD-IIB family hydrolase [Enterococcus faecium]|uniref:Cof-type HAD-IIB family hydrolase n=1 Tax=Enterococcus faecium TaxID=1352 RepID=UPI001E439C53|nr:Cof-type HAD-IIB family hydrolase [Enterococcus faecium]MCE3183125.1 Cof-type HAD-IIB family hydrolase [Enterococcus faecium]MCW8789477.1 Cof-type HAD-IIB family hydrolase [Enterococcus faecium]MCW8791895.1 Cof-type HAD-IIB family hydrolase [Enterococcus faecium]MCW8794511.1 Cof-type HAD-IIB family hydrolase [Enterococcus faecium]MDV7731972.1 Cof-type HAD-IIB family hydrolase [Enterococcus faecium]
MSNYRAITFFDLDGTLLDAKSKITPEVAKAMNALKENNVLPVIATGRTEAEIHSIMEDAGITSAVTMNGSFIRVDGEEIYSQTFSSEECQKMYDHVQLNGHELSYYNDQKIWCTGHSQTMINAYDFIHSDVPEIDPLGFKENTVNMLLILSQSGDEYYHEHFPELTFYRNGPYSIDTVKKGISKGAGVKRLQKELQLEKVPTFGFGDGPNDFALLEACDNKIAMDNAYDGLKELSTFITKKNTEDGIVHALKYFDLI